MADLNNNNSLYAAFKNAHPSWLLIGCAFSYGIIAVFGICFNFCVIYVTICAKSLNGTANFLLALCSFFELLHQSCHFLFVFVAFSGQNFIEYQTAAWIAAPSVFGLGGTAISMFFTGLDRLICVVSGQMHSKFKVRFYLGTLTFVCALFCVALLYTLYLTDEELHGLLITGCIVDIMQGPSIQFFAPTTLYVNMATIVIYVIIGIAVKIKTDSSVVQNSTNNNVESTNRRILRSLFAIIAVNMGGYLVATGYVVIVRPSVESPITAWLWQVITGIPLNISAASNGPILYMTSTEYRQAFRSVFPSAFKLLQRVTKAPAVAAHQPPQNVPTTMALFTVNPRRHGKIVQLVKN